MRGDLEIRGETPRGRGQRALRKLGGDLGGKPGSVSRSRPTVDRRDFGLDWQAELPSGGEVLDYAVRIAVELELVEEGDSHAGPRHLRQPAPGVATTHALLRAAAERLPAGVELVEFEGLRDVPPYDEDLE